MTIETSTDKKTTTTFLDANETMATYTMTRAWSWQPEEWTLFIHTGDNPVIECIQQTGDLHLSVTTMQITLSTSEDIGHNLIIQTSGHGHFQFKLTEFVFQDVAWLLRDFIATSPSDFLSTHRQEANRSDAILVNFFEQATQTWLFGQLCPEDL